MSAKRKCPDSPMGVSPAKCKNRHILTLSEKVEVIKAIDSGMNKTNVANKFNCDRTQILNIMNNKQGILDTFANGRKSSSKQIEHRTILYADIDVLL